MTILLDTCTFLRLALPQSKLSEEAMRLLALPSTTLFLSDVSLWEICRKHSTGKLSLPGEPRQWMPSRMEFFQVQSLSLQQDAIFRSGELPKVHPDPFDRLLAAQAIEAGMTILSPDSPLSALGASRVW
ncbi:MAG: type II toxin-antitoxin system VapC family toxin [Verrucomicrobiales bacterium]|nr:type II toxin-antitoxin system VapC family toxin [Verrucomicrobiales bacterium]MCP5557495.1 type II toxin-antitoxin system VapC family toxin [Verrucomicrobiaceae bacterium]